jgi:hypothetical protein
MGIEELRTAPPIEITDPNLGGSRKTSTRVSTPINITDPNLTKPIDIVDPNLAAQQNAIQITDPNLARSAKKTTANLSSIAGHDLDRGRVQQAIDGIDSTGARVVSGRKIITPDMVPNIPDPDQPKTIIMQDQEIEKLHNIIDRKQEEMQEEMQMLRDQSEANKKILMERGVRFDENGEPLDDIENIELTEEEDLEAALDMDIKQEQRFQSVKPEDIIMAPGVPMSDPNHEYEGVDDETFDQLMKEDDEMNGNFYEEDDPRRNLSGVQVAPISEVPEPEDTQEQELAEALEDAEGDEIPTVMANAPEEPVVSGYIAEDEPEVTAVPEMVTMTTPTDPEPIETVSANAESADDDLDKELEEATNETEVTEDLSQEELDKEMEELAKQASETFDLAPNHIDLTGFKIGAPVSAKSVLASMPSTADSSDWALATSGTPISMRKFNGTELRDLASYASGRRNRQNTITERYKMLYDHDTNPYKPDSVEAWAKTINAADNDDLYFCVYDATFHNANHIPYSCECGHSWISPHIPTSEMVKFDDPEFEAEFMAIRERGHYKGEFRKVSKKIVPVTDHIAVGVKNADLYDINFVYRLVGQDFYTKYQDTLQIFPFIDEFYNIDLKNGRLQPISTDPRNKEGDLAKSIKNRVIIFNRIIKSLNPDEYNVLIAAAGKPVEGVERKISYVIPATTCPKCGKVIEEVPLDGEGGNSMENQLFTRRPLALIVNT